MKRWIAAAAGLFGLVAYVRRRRKAAPPPAVEPADELRAKLAQSKEEPRAEPEPDAPAKPVEAPDPDALGERRQDVHDRARAAMDELGGS